MGFLNNLIKQVFPDRSDTETSEKEVLVREMINHTETFKKGYKNWLSDEMHLGILEDLNTKYKNWKANSKIIQNYYVHESANSNGFYFRKELTWNVEDYSFLIQFFIEKLTTQGYLVNNSIREATEENGELKTVEEFFLKPSLKYKKTLPYNQLYGNVLIEHRMTENDTELVKVLVNSYNDHNYKKAIGFEVFMDDIFSAQ